MEKNITANGITAIVVVVTATMILLSLKKRKDPKKLPNSPKTQLVTLSVSNFYFSTLLLSVFPHSTSLSFSPFDFAQINKVTDSK